MSAWQAHWPILPILFPLLAGAALLLLRDVRPGYRATVAVASTLAQLLVGGGLLAMTDGWVAGAWPGGAGVYALGGWAAPFGIVLVADRLAAVMLTLAAALGLAVLVYSFARWERAGSHYLPLFQFLLMGLNGAFLTGDLFNLFVFFEVLLTASYGLALHGSGPLRVKSAMHYIVVNLVASSLFLVAAALIYGVTGTLNMAELAQRVARLDVADRSLFDMGAALLGIVFLVKAGAWPLNFWLPAAYGSATPPVAGVFAILTKVGVYALLRFSVLLQDVDAPPPFEGDWLFYCGLATMAAGSCGVLASQKLDLLVSYLVIVSSGTLLAAFGFLGTTLTGPALYYLVGSVLGSGAFFLLAELAERNRSAAADLLAISFEALGLQRQDRYDAENTYEMSGVAIPAAMAFLGLAFFSCALLLIGLPPFSGFVAKFALISAAIAAQPYAPSWHIVLFVASLLLSGLAGLISLSRLGVRMFWESERLTLRLHWIEAAPVGALILSCVALTMVAGPAMSFFETTAQSLHDVSLYARSVLPAADNVRKRP
jgi:multicomponent K+:H+ antiporter subunit D